MTEHVDALVIFGATGDLAKLETFPALVGLVGRGVLDVPVIGVAKSGWDLAQFRAYAEASLRLNGMDPGAPDAASMLGLLDYVDGDLGEDATYRARGGQGASPAGGCCSTSRYRRRCSDGSPSGIGAAGLADGRTGHGREALRVGSAGAQQLNATMHEVFPEEAVCRVDHWLGLDPVENVLFGRFANSIIEPMLNRT